MVTRVSRGVLAAVVSFTDARGYPEEHPRCCPTHAVASGDHAGYQGPRNPHWCASDEARPAGEGPNPGDHDGLHGENSEAGAGRGLAACAHVAPARCCVCQHKGDATKIACSYKSLPTSVTPGQIILAADGNIMMEVVECKTEYAPTALCWLRVVLAPWPAGLTHTVIVEPSVAAARSL